MTCMLKASIQGWRGALYINLQCKEVPHCCWYVGQEKTLLLAFGICTSFAACSLIKFKFNSVLGMIYEQQLTSVTKLFPCCRHVGVF